MSRLNNAGPSRQVGHFRYRFANKNQNTSGTRAGKCSIKFDLIASDGFGAPGCVFEINEQNTKCHRSSLALSFSNTVNFGESSNFLNALKRVKLSRCVKSHRRFAIGLVFHPLAKIRAKGIPRIYF